MTTDQLRCQHYDTCQTRVYDLGYNRHSPYAKRLPRPLQPICYYCGGYDPIPVYNVIEKRTIYCENVTDGMFLKLKAEVQNVKDKVITHISLSKPKGKYKEYKV